MADWSQDSDESDSPSWVEDFCCTRGNEFFCQVDKAWIEDRFNLHGLNKLPNFDEARKVILDRGSSKSEKQEALLEKVASHIYGLIHARYILTEQGLSAMLSKYKNNEFGKCPRVLCNGQPMLPIGLSDTPGTSFLKLFCPCCEDLYFPQLARHGKLDGAYFGTTFAHLFLQTYPKYYPRQEKEEKYIPRIFGYKLHRTSKDESLRKEEEKEELNREWSRQQKAAAAERRAGRTPVPNVLPGFGRGVARPQQMNSPQQIKTQQQQQQQQFPTPEPPSTTATLSKPNNGELVVSLSTDST